LTFITAFYPLTSEAQDRRLCAVVPVNWNISCALLLQLSVNSQFLHLTSAGV